MALDLYIHGPGFGEMILMRWKEGRKAHAAIVDVHCPNSKVDRLLLWLDNEHVRHLSFIAITHPHLDHIRNADEVLRAYKKRVARLWYWPGLNQAAYLPFFNRLAKTFPRSELRQRAAAVRDFFVEHKRQFYDERLGSPELMSFTKATCIYPIGRAPEALEVTCASPWDDPIMDFSRIVNDGIRPGGAVTDTHHQCNLVSGGFLIRHGKAQVFLGGDMETENWGALRASGAFGDFRPCVVKVSHHGSATGCLPDMWGEDGFLGRHKPVAVITPWRKKLPDQTVIDRIRSSGCETYVTGACRPRVDDGFPHIHLRVNEDPAVPVEVIHRSPSVRRIP
jgi:hypothetical protein